MRSGRATEGLGVAIEPTNPQYRRNLGQALLQMGRTDEAKSYLRE